MSVIVRYMSLSGPFKEVKVETAPDLRTALLAVSIYATAAGYTNVAVADDAEYGDEGSRITARTPGGRGGRNIAFVDPNYEVDS